MIPPAALLVALLLDPGAVRAQRAAADLEAKLDPTSEKLGGGYTRVGAMRSGGLGEGQTVRFSFLLEKGQCYRFLALGSDKVKDLDLRVFEGVKLLAGDTGSVPRPVVQYCAEASAKVEARLQLFKGTGQYAFALYSRGGSAEDLGNHSGVEADALRALEEARQEIAPGMEQVGQPHTNHLGHRSARKVEAVLDRPRCYKFIAVGGGGVTDLSLTVIADGKEVASDRISGRRPVVDWCAPARMTVEVKLGMYGGSGQYALGIYGKSAEARQPTEKVGGTGTDFVSNRIRQLHAQFGKGRAAVSPVLKGNLSTNNEQVFKVRLQAGHCYTIVGAGSPSVRNLDIVLLDRAKREIQRDKSSNNFPTFHTDPCPSSSGQYMVRVKMVSGYGQFAAQVFSD